MGPDSCSLQTVHRVEKLPSSEAWNMCLSLAFLMQPLVCTGSGRWEVGEVVSGREAEFKFLKPQKSEQTKTKLEPQLWQNPGPLSQKLSSHNEVRPCAAKTPHSLNTTQQRPSVFKYAVRPGCKLFKPSSSCTYDYFVSRTVHNNGGQHESKGDEITQEKEKDDDNHHFVATQFTVRDS